MLRVNLSEDGKTERGRLSISCIHHRMRMLVNGQQNSLLKHIRGGERGLPVGTPQPSRHTLSNGAIGSIFATLTSWTTVYWLKVDVPMK